MISKSWRGRLAPVVGIFALTGLAFGAATAAGDDGGDPQPVDFTHNVVGRAGARHGRRLRHRAGGRRPARRSARRRRSSRRTSTPTASGMPPAQRDVDRRQPHRPDNIIGGANDYQLGLNPGGHVSETLLSRAHVTFDGGKTWSDVPAHLELHLPGHRRPGRRVRRRRPRLLRHARLPLRRPGQRAEPGRSRLRTRATAARPGHVAASPRAAASRPASATCSTRSTSRRGATATRSSPTATSGSARRAASSAPRSTPRSRTTTATRGAAPQLISGDLDEAFVSVPTVASDGRIFVAFMNTDDLTTGRDTYYVVEVDPATGARVGGPFAVGAGHRRFHRLPDRVRPADLPGQRVPLLGGRQHHRRSDRTRPTWRWSGRTCATALRPAPTNPYDGGDQLGRDRQPVDRLRAAPGRAPAAVDLAGDQFMPWGAFDAVGHAADRHVRSQRRLRPTTCTTTRC